MANHDDSMTDCEFAIASYVCPVGRLSDRDEEISIVQSLPQQIEPNRHVSQTVDRAIARHAELVDRQAELVENRFKAINDQIERRIAEASRALDECLDIIDGSLSDFLGDRRSDEYMRSDSLRTCFAAVDELLSRRDRKIDEYAAALRDLETERTALVQDCHDRHMAGIVRLSRVAYGRLYEKYLKDYNAIKLANFRTYENARTRLALSAAGVRHGFAVRAHDVRSTIGRDVARRFADTFRTAAATIAAEAASVMRTGAIGLLRDVVHGLFGELTRDGSAKRVGADVAYVTQCSDSLRTHADALDAVADGATRSRDRALETIRSLLESAVDGYATTVAGGPGERLGPGHLTAVNDDMSAEASAARRRVTDDVSDVRLLLDDVERALGTIGATLGPALGIVRGHSKRSADATDAAAAHLETAFRRNDSKTNALGEQLDAALDALARASDETEMAQLAEICDDVTEHIRHRTERGRQREMEVVSKFRDLMASDLEACRSAARKVRVDVVSIPIFDYAAQNGSWTASVTSEITSFKTALKTCRQTLHKQLSSFVARVKISDFPFDECALANFKRIVDERFDVKSKVFQLRTIALRDRLVNKRLDEFEQHRNLLERHVTDARENSDRLQHDTKQMYGIFDLKTNELILKNIELVGTHVEELSVYELTELIEKLRRKIDSVADELNSAYKSHCDMVESDYRAIEHSTTEFMKSIKTFPDGGDYGDEEAVYTVNVLNALTNTMSQEQSNIVKTLTKHSYEPIDEIKQLLGRMLKPLEIELRKKACKQTYYSINRLVNVAVARDVSKLEKNMDFLRAKLHDVKAVLENGEIGESSRRWSEMLSETRAFMGFVLQSFRDIRSPLKSKIKPSTWNIDNEKAYTTSSVMITAKSTHTISSGELELLDRGKSATTGGRRFLNDVYLSVSHYIAESQKNAADLASAESSASTWFGERPNATQTYNEIVDEALSRGKTIVLQAESVWIVALSDFFDFLCREYHATERRFKNAVLATYHDESVTKMDAAFAAFPRESDEVRGRLKKIREGIGYMLKPSHGHPLNAQRLENLLADFRRANSECMNTLTDTCTGMETKLKRIVENYEKECPKDVLEAITLTVKRYSTIKTKLDSINVKVVDAGYESEIMSEAMAARIAAKDTVGLALNNVKERLRTETGAVFWPENKLLWTNNVQAFRKLYRVRLGDVRVFGAVEKSKSIDWATNFVRDVERVKGFYDNEHNGWCAPL